MKNVKNRLLILIASALTTTNALAQSLLGDDILNESTLKVFFFTAIPSIILFLIMRNLCAKRFETSSISNFVSVNVIEFFFNVGFLFIYSQWMGFIQLAGNEILLLVSVTMILIFIHFVISFTLCMKVFHYEVFQQESIIKHFLCQNILFIIICLLFIYQWKEVSFYIIIGAVALVIVACNSFIAEKELVNAIGASKEKAILNNMFGFAKSPTAKATTASSESRDTRKCPYCGEEILKVAKKCRYCGEWISEENAKDEKKEYIQCPICGEDIEKGTIVCPHCKEQVNI